MEAMRELPWNSWWWVHAAIAPHAKALVSTDPILCPARGQLLPSLTLFPSEGSSKTPPHADVFF
ncbi:hypothetical protein F751_4196 [Auxenochlorella protothecoides]|uniref:Uncharacterized protein n=1 Tax=Auxenochlorella protothecoides TaxID=3075 RepID=A0A087SJP0_AUXPR|nr:hypothetical protein F751_4196 [Auxenochlorella protothecoides]KFM25944.1 hypothetical protein F751_4196 [Auxenochlorella protothecoides]